MKEADERVYSKTLRKWQPPRLHLPKVQYGITLKLRPPLPSPSCPRAPDNALSPYACMHGKLVPITMAARALPTHQKHMHHSIDLVSTQESILKNLY